jgi:chemotaxis protein histidine kinase CheA
MGKPSAPAPPDYTPVAQAAQTQLQMSDAQVAAQESEAQQQFALDNTAYTNQSQQAAAQLAQSKSALDLATTSANQQYGLEQTQLSDAEKQAAAAQAQNQEVADSQVATQAQANAAAQAAQARYQSVYQPLEDKAVAYAQNYDTPQQRALNQGAAASAVTSAADSARVAAAQNLESFGVDPSSTRYAALDVGMRTQAAGAAAGAATQAGLQTDATGQQYIANAINVGRGLPADVNASANTAINAGNSAANVNNSTLTAGTQATGTAVQYGSLGNNSVGNINQGIGVGTNAISAADNPLGLATSTIGSGNGALGAANQTIGTWGNTLNQGYQNQLGQFNATQAASSGLGSILGAAAGFASGIPGLAEGGAVPSDEAVALNPGSAVPVSASPSGGKAVDDVPARLTPGEFVTPNDVVQWKGEEFFQKLIQKSREDRAKNSPAQARPMAVPIAPPAYSSRPTQAVG